MGEPFHSSMQCLREELRSQLRANVAVHDPGSSSSNVRRRGIQRPGNQQSATHIGCSKKQTANSNRLLKGNSKLTKLPPVNKDRNKQRSKQSSVAHSNPRAHRGTRQKSQETSSRQSHNSNNNARTLRVDLGELPGGFRELLMKRPREPETWIAVTDEGTRMGLSEQASIEGFFGSQLCEAHPMIFISIKQDHSGQHSYLCLLDAQNRL